MYKILDKKNKESVIHHDRIKLCKDRDHPIWLKRARAKYLNVSEKEAGTNEPLGINADDLNIEDLFSDGTASQSDTLTLPGDLGDMSDTLTSIQGAGTAVSENDDAPLSVSHSKFETERSETRQRKRNKPAYLSDYILFED